jgi:hypothetical protein
MKRWKGDRSSIIRLVHLQGNPKRAGSKAENRFSRYRDGMTIDQYIEACRDAPRGEDALLDIAWDLSHSFIEVLPPRIRA